MKAIFFSDPHITARTPPYRRDDYLAAITGKLQYLQEYQIANNVDAVFCLGDIFHYKQPSKTPLRVLIQLLLMFREFKGLYLLPGNHDLRSGRLDSLHSQPLGLLLEAGAGSFENRVSLPGAEVTLVPYSSDFTAELADLVPDAGTSGLQILCTHALMSAASPESVLPLQGKGYQIVVNGHTHVKEGPVRVGGLVLANLPPLGRRIYGTEKETKVVEFLEITTPGNAEWVTVPHAPYEEAFDHEQRIEEVRERDDLKDFIEKSSLTTMVAGGWREALYEVYKTLDEPVRRQVDTYLND